MKGSLDLIASESKRCGELVQNLLSFSRVSPMNLAWCDLNQVIDRCIRLVQHKLDSAAYNSTWISLRACRQPIAIRRRSSRSCSRWLSMRSTPCRRKVICGSQTCLNADSALETRGPRRRSRYPCRASRRISSSLSTRRKSRAARASDWRSARTSSSATAERLKWIR